MAEQVVPPVPPVPPPDVKLPTTPPPDEKAPRGMEWKEALTELSKERDSLREKARAYESEVQTFRQKESERLKAESIGKDQAEQNRLEQEGNYKQALKNTEEKWQNKYNQSQNLVNSRLIPMAIQAAAAQIKGLSPQAIADLPKLVGEEVALNPETLDVYIRDPKTGKPMVDDKLNPVTVESYIERFASERPYLLVDNLPHRHGQSQGGGKSPVTFEMALQDRKIMDAWEKADPEGLKLAQAEWYNPKNVLERTKKQLGMTK